MKRNGADSSHSGNCAGPAYGMIKLRDSMSQAGYSLRTKEGQCTKARPKFREGTPTSETKVSGGAKKEGILLSKATKVSLAFFCPRAPLIRRMPIFEACPFSGQFEEGDPGPYHSCSLGMNGMLSKLIG